MCIITWHKSSHLKGVFLFVCSLCLVRCEKECFCVPPETHTFHVEYNVYLLHCNYRVHWKHFRSRIWLVNWRWLLNDKVNVCVFAIAYFTWITHQHPLSSSIQARKTVTWLISVFVGVVKWFCETAHHRVCKVYIFQAPMARFFPQACRECKYERIV